MLKINHSLSLLAALIGLLPINHVFSDVGLAPQSAPAAQGVVASNADQSQRRADWAALTPEQRDQKRAERKAKRSLMSPAAREQFKAERRAQLNGLSASDRERRMTQQRAFQSDRMQKPHLKAWGRSARMAPPSHEAREAFRQARKAKLDAMSREERDQMMSDRRARLEGLPEADRQAVIDRRRARRDFLESTTP